jgi:hypothetical protein
VSYAVTRYEALILVVTLALTINMKVSALTGADFETLSYIEHNCTMTVRESGWLCEPAVAEHPSYPCYHQITFARIVTSARVQSVYLEADSH